MSWLNRSKSSRRNARQHVCMSAVAVPPCGLLSHTASSPNHGISEGSEYVWSIFGVDTSLPSALIVEICAEICTLPCSST